MSNDENTLFAGSNPAPRTILFMARQGETRRKK